MADDPIVGDLSNHLIELAQAVVAERDKLREIADRARWMEHAPACATSGRPCYCGHDELQVMIDDTLGPNEVVDAVRHYERNPAELYAKGKAPKSPAKIAAAERAQLDEVLRVARSVVIAHRWTEPWADVPNDEGLWWLDKTVDDLMDAIRAVDVHASEDPDQYIHDAPSSPPPRPPEQP